MSAEGSPRQITFNLREGVALEALQREAERRLMPLEALVTEMLYRWYAEEVLGQNPTLTRLAQINRTRPRQ